MRRGDEKLGDDILVLRRHAGATLAAATLGAEGVERGALDIAVEGNGDDHLLALDEVFVVDAVGGGSDERPARSREFVAHRDQLFAHHAIKFDTVGENRKQFLNDGGQLTEFLADFVATERGEAVETEVEDRLHLYFGQAIGGAVLHLALDRFDEANVGSDFADRPFAQEQGFAGGGGAVRSADDADDFVEVRHRDDEAEQDVGTVARLREFELAAARYHFLAEGNEGGEDVLQPHHFGAATADREHVRGEARLRRGMAPELVEDDLGGRVALQFDDEAHALAGRFVANVGDALDALVRRRLGAPRDAAPLPHLDKARR